MASNEDPSSVDTETIDVTPIISNTSSSTECKYCKEPENKQDKPGMICENCVSLVHLSCLRRPGTPGDFACDVFFDFTCEDCSPNNKEIFLRNRFPWVNVIHLTLHHLNMQSYGISNHGYFHYKTHICSFIDRYWHSLFGTQTKQKKNWVGTIAGVLSVYNKLFFKSGSVVLGETGWWKLLHNFSPAVAAHIIQEIAKDKPKMKPRNQMTIDKNLFIAKVAEMGYKDLVCESADPPMTSPVEVVPFKKRRVDWEADTANTSQEQSETEVNQEGTSDGFEEPAILVPVKSAETDYKVLEFASSSYVPPIQSDTSSVNSQQPYLFYDSDSRSSLQDNKPQEEEPTTKKTEEENPIRSISLFSDKPNSISMPWIRKLPKPSEDLVEMSPYEEVQLLKKLEGIVGRVKDPIRRAELYRLKAKLSLRRLKRHKHLPVFDFDKTVKLLGGYVSDDRRVVLNAERVLDRFQRSYLMDNLSGTISNSNCGTLLLCHIEPTPFRSPYSGAMLKPFIRIDQEVKPLWLQMTDELLKKTNRNIPDYAPPPHATLDFSYVRPQHIAAVNSLCAQFFWPGIDLTEALQYPEFSCVVTYKRLVVGCAFLVPDAGRNEAYISFVIARPHWRRAGLATFMLYHLLQTCTGKDVTLHVSPTNPAIFLYQKFGFKVEELIQDFYEKYYDIDYKGCRHALFLRLAR